jgi:UDP-3-O-[3-hydroxymyristoyl] glucosamine N-acyltransferase
MITRTVSELAALCGAVLEGDGARVVTGPAGLSEATSDEISFLANPRYARDLEATSAAAVLVHPGLETSRRDLALLRCADPSRAFTHVIRAFRTEQRRPDPGVHPRASVDPSARVGRNVSIAPLAFVGPGAVLGDRVVLHPGACVGARAKVGEDSELHPNAVLYEGVVVGARCILHAGAVIGSDGFGFEPTAEGWEKIPQCGTVVIEDDVEIGANTTIDRARFGETRIGAGAKLDNLVHLAHNVQVGAGALLVAQVGVAGSSRIGRRAVLGGQVGVIGHLRIGDGVRIAAQSGIMRDAEPGEELLGSPARGRARQLRNKAALERLPDLVSSVRALEERLERRADEASDAAGREPGGEER